MLFTKEAGMIWATARSVREERSKQRYALQDFSHMRVSLIKGKSGWRVGSAEALGNPFMRARTRHERALVNFVFVQLRRYVHGEIMLPSVYGDVSEVLAKVTQFETRWSAVGQIFLLRLLSELGYIAPEPPWEALVRANSIEDAFSLYSDALSPAIDSAIETAKHASHL